jgi:hypothetical protein
MKGRSRCSRSSKCDMSQRIREVCGLKPWPDARADTYRGGLAPSPVVSALSPELSPVGKPWESQHPDKAVFSGCERSVQEFTSEAKSPAKTQLFAC